jgi:hypothetical protein
MNTNCMKGLKIWLISCGNFKVLAVIMKKIVWIISMMVVVACSKNIPAVKIAEESMMKDCAYVATLSDMTDPGRALDNYRSPDHQDRVLERAANLGATHVVWVYDYRIGSAAVAYRCGN